MVSELSKIDVSFGQEQMEKAHNLLIDRSVPYAKHPRTGGVRRVRESRAPGPRDLGAGAARAPGKRSCRLVLSGAPSGLAGGATGPWEGSVGGSREVRGTAGNPVAPASGPACTGLYRPPSVFWCPCAVRWRRSRDLHLQNRGTRSYGLKQRSAVGTTKAVNLSG